ncbi:MAG TPA: hypothetical protein VLQ93_12560, partial [Myxococcaceae bacterium]|nr:hypothetical protein [Myxococcaceae bacterium]
RQRARKALTVVVPIRPERVGELTRFLTAIGEDIVGNPHIRFERLRRVHFMRWVVLPGEACEGVREASRPLLALEGNFDGTAGEFLDELLAVCGPALKEHIYSHCEPASHAGCSDEELKGLLLEHVEREATFYAAYPHLTVERIDNDARVRQCLHRCLAGPETRPLESRVRPGVPQALLSEEEQRQRDARLLECLRRHLTEVALVQEPGLELSPVRPSWRTRLARTGVVRSFFGALVLPVAVPVGLGLLALEGRRTGAESLSARGEEALRSLRVLVEREDWKAQNQLTHCVDVEPGRVRLLLLKATVRCWGYLAKHFFNQGALGGIEGIHFARWVILKDGERHRLLFFSNYDGSWEGYLGSFIDRAAIGLTSIWCNARGFPRTRLVRQRPFVKLGARNAEQFKQWVRRCQLPTQVWFTRHPELGTGNILNDSHLRAMALARMSPAQVREWLQRL